MIQYIYTKYGREQPGSPPPSSPIGRARRVREVGQGLRPFGRCRSRRLTGIDLGLVGRRRSASEQAKAGGLDPDDPPIARRCSTYASEIIGFPRHLSQHVGGFVITRDRLDEIVPDRARRRWTSRTMVEWDKDDLDALGILKVDILALGMLTCLRQPSSCCEQHYDARTNERSTLATIPKEDGRGLRHDLPRRHARRLPDREPRADVDAAAPQAARILRSRHRGGDRPPRPDPGRHGASLSAPAAGQGEDPTIRSTELEAGARSARWACRCSRSRRCRSPSSPPASRRARPTSCAAPWPPSGAPARSAHYRDKMVDGMVGERLRRAISPSAASRQIEGFGEYGFPESHAASFALLVYASCWFKATIRTSSARRS